MRQIGKLQLRQAREEKREKGGRQRQCQQWQAARLAAWQPVRQAL